jgi:type I restriction enzyme S subunit
MIGKQLEYSESLPPSWSIRTVGEIGMYLNGFAFKPAQWSTKGLPIIRIQNLNDRNKPFNYYDGEVPEKYRIRNGDILISWSASLGTYRWDRGDAWLNQHIFKATPNLEELSDEFFYWVMVHGIERIAGNARGSTMKHVTGKEFANSEVAVPPPPEQKRIAHILSTVQRAIEAQERIIQTTTELKKALMHKLFTEGTRGEKQKNSEIGPIPMSWEVVRLSDVCRFQSGGTPSKKNPEYWQGTIPWVSPKDMKRPRLNDVGDHISQEALESGSKLAPAGSVFIVVRGMILAKTVPVALAEVPMAINQDMKAIVPGTRLRSDFLLYALEAFRDNLFKKVGRSGHGTCTLMGHEVAAFRIPLPDLETQEVVASAIQNLDRKRDLHGEQRQQLQDLFRTLLHELMTAKVRVDSFPA